MSMGGFLKKLRKDAGLSQQDVATKLGMARATYASLEVDRREPDLGELRAIAEFYEISMMALVAEEGDDWPGVIHEPTPEYRSRKTKIVDKELIQEDASEFNPAKLRAILLHILTEVGGYPNFGESVLHKLLYFIDTNYSKACGQAITGLTYVHSRFGPTPTKVFDELVQQMQADEELEIIATDHFNNTQKKYLALKTSDFQNLSAKELQHINRTLTNLADKTPDELLALYTQTKQGNKASVRNYAHQQLESGRV